MMELFSSSKLLDDGIIFDRINYPFSEFNDQCSYRYLGEVHKLILCHTCMLKRRSFLVLSRVCVNETNMVGLSYSSYV